MNKNTALKGESKTVLTCVHCAKKGNTIKWVSETKLCCCACGETYERSNYDCFFHFYSGSQCKNGSLLEHEKPEKRSLFKKCIIDMMLSELRRCIKVLNIKNLVDIGCGNGAYAKILEGTYQMYYGLEPSLIPAHKMIADKRYLSNSILIRYDTAHSFPICNASIDCITFLSSYDHIPNVAAVLKDAYEKLKDGGNIVILMTNYGFWVKRVVNFITGKKLFMHEEHHFRVHTPDSLIKEVSSIIDVSVENIRADFSFLPKLPQRFQFLYCSEILIKVSNFLIKIIFRLLRFKHAGSVQIITFKKTQR